jgi:hypothetical protein
VHGLLSGITQAGYVFTLFNVRVGGGRRLFAFFLVAIRRWLRNAQISDLWGPRQRSLKQVLEAFDLQLEVLVVLFKPVDSAFVGFLFDFVLTDYIHHEARHLVKL